MELESLYKKLSYAQDEEFPESVPLFLDSYDVWKDEKNSEDDLPIYESIIGNQLNIGTVNYPELKQQLCMASADTSGVWHTKWLNDEMDNEQKEAIEEYISSHPKLESANINDEIDEVIRDIYNTGWQAGANDDYSHMEDDNLRFIHYRSKIIQLVKKYEG